MSWDWIVTITVIVAFGALTVFAGWKSGRPRKDSLNVQWISWPLVTVLAGTAVVFAVIHVITLMGYHTGGNLTQPYVR